MRICSYNSQWVSQANMVWARTTCSNNSHSRWCQISNLRCLEDRFHRTIRVASIFHKWCYSSHLHNNKLKASKWAEISWWWVVACRYLNNNKYWTHSHLTPRGKSTGNNSSKCHHSHPLQTMANKWDSNLSKEPASVKWCPLCRTMEPIHLPGRDNRPMLGCNSPRPCYSHSSSLHHVCMRNSQLLCSNSHHIWCRCNLHRDPTCNRYHNHKCANLLVNSTLKLDNRWWSLNSNNSHCHNNWVASSNHNHSYNSNQDLYNHSNIQIPMD